MARIKDQRQRRDETELSSVPIYHPPAPPGNVHVVARLPRMCLSEARAKQALIKGVCVCVCVCLFLFIRGTL